MLPRRNTLLCQSHHQPPVFSLGRDRRLPQQFAPEAPTPVLWINAEIEMGEMPVLPSLHKRKAPPSNDLGLVCIPASPGVCARKRRDVFHLCDGLFQRHRRIVRERLRSRTVPVTVQRGIVLITGSGKIK